METAVLYCGARRTAYCQELLRNSGFQMAQIHAVGANPVGQLGGLLAKNRLVLLLGPERSGEPTFGGPFFQALHVPMLEGSPQGVLVLHGPDCIGWLIESREQAVALLPDRPEHLSSLLPELWLRLREKFELPQPAVPSPALNYDKLVERAFARKEQP